MKIEKEFRYADISMPIAISVQIDYIELGKNSSTSSFHQKKSWMGGGLFLLRMDEHAVAE